MQPIFVQRGCAFQACHSPQANNDFKLRSGSVGFFSAVALRKNYAKMVPIPSGDPGLFFVTRDGAVQTLPASGWDSPQEVHGTAGKGSVLMSAGAVTPA